MLRQKLIDQHYATLISNSERRKVLQSLLA